MVTRVCGSSLSAIAAAILVAPLAAQAADIRVMCYQDGIECNVTAELAKKFEAANPGTKVILDVVPYKTIVEQLPVQLAAGQGPDIARVTDLGGLSKYYLDISAHVKDRAYWESNFGSTLPWLRPSATDKGIYGFMSQLTMTGPYVNKTLFDQAKVALPGPKATWDEWVEAARKVSKATQTQAALAWDRSGHRFAGPAISYGAKIFDAKGELVIDDGYKTAVSKFVGWHKDGAMLKEVWGGSGGSTYADSIGEFKNGRVAMVLSGSWQINRHRQRLRLGRRAQPLRPRSLHRHSRWRCLGGPEDQQVAQGSRHVPGLHGPGSQLRRVHGQDREHPGPRRPGQEGRRLPHRNTGRTRRTGHLQRRGGQPVAGRVPVPGLPVQPRHHAAHGHPRDPGHRGRDEHR